MWPTFNVYSCFAANLDEVAAATQAHYYACD